MDDFCRIKNELFDECSNSLVKLVFQYLCKFELESLFRQKQDETLSFDNDFYTTEKRIKSLVSDQTFSNIWSFLQVRERIEELRAL